MSRHTTVPTLEPGDKPSCSNFDKTLLKAGFATRCGAGLLRRAFSLPLLDDAERATRTAQLNRLWTAGARRCIDEGLLADAIRRNPHIALTLAGAAAQKPGTTHVQTEQTGRKVAK